MVKSRQMPSLAIEHITRSILVLRSQRVLLDVELADLYGVATKVLLQTVKRNHERFPEDFMIQLTASEWAVLRSQTVTSSAQHGGRRYPPYAFTEQGVAMLSSVLKSRRAIAVNVQIMRAFVRMRELLASNTALARKLDELERKYQHHDQAIKAILSAIRELMTPAAPQRRPIGFTANLGECQITVSSPGRAARLACRGAGFKTERPRPGDAVDAGRSASLWLVPNRVPDAGR